PPVIVIHGNQTNRLPGDYKRYLENAFRDALKLKGTPIRFEFKTGKNPYAGKKKKIENTRDMSLRERTREHRRRR
ncbi:MAG: ribosome biogenesis GTPase Der, partial [bacterium]